MPLVTWSTGFLPASVAEHLDFEPEVAEEESAEEKEPGLDSEEPETTASPAARALEARLA